MMTTCRFRDPKTNQILIGKLNGQGVCEYDPEAQALAAQGYWSEKDKKENRKQKAQAPEISHLTPKELAGLYCAHKNFCTPTKVDFEEEKLELYARVTSHFKATNCAIPLDMIDFKDIEKKIKKQNISLDKSQFQNPQYVLNTMKKHLKIMIPFFPKMTEILSVRPNLYFSHMLWFIGIFGNQETGIANVRQSFFQNYLSISARTERRLRDFFVKNRIFNCTYDRKSHYLHISVNWEGLDEFLRNFDENLSILPEELRTQKPLETLEEETQEALAQAIDNALENERETPIKEPEEPSLDPVSIRLTQQEKLSFDSFSKQIDADKNALSHIQIQTAISDLGCSNLFNPAFIVNEGRYIGCDPKHVLLPFFEKGTYDTCLVLKALVREVPHLIPIPRPFENVPEFYYSGEDHEMNPFWGAREKMVFGFTRRIAHLAGMSFYKKIIGEISIVEWNSIPASNSYTKKPLTQFVIATRNGVAAHIVGIFLTWIISKFEDDSFEFRIVPLENGVALSNDTRPW